MMTKIVLADSETLFRAGIAKVLAVEEDLRVVAQCADVESMHNAVNAFPGSIVMFAASMVSDLRRLQSLMETAGSRGIVIAESKASPHAYLQQGLRGVIFRSVTAPDLVLCVRRVAEGATWVPPIPVQTNSSQSDLLGIQARDRLNPKELRIVALVVKGCRSQVIANRLGTTEQVIKNYLRTIYVKAGVSDRLDLAMFTMRHPALAHAVDEAGARLEVQQQPSSGAVA